MLSVLASASSLAPLVASEKLVTAQSQLNYGLSFGRCQSVNGKREDDKLKNGVLVLQLPKPNETHNLSARAIFAFNPQCGAMVDFSSQWNGEKTSSPEMQPWKVRANSKVSVQSSCGENDKKLGESILTELIVEPYSRLSIMHADSGNIVFVGISASLYQKLFSKICDPKDGRVPALIFAKSKRS